jgi:hypothetical protein
MIQLQHIKETRCPKCNSERKSATQEQQHCNGEWNESATFGCGLNIRYSPNFRRQSDHYPCRLNPKFRRQAEIDEKAKARVLKYITNLKCSQALRDRLLADVQYTISKNF